MSKPNQVKSAVAEHFVESVPKTKNFYAEALSPIMIVFGHNALKVVIKVKRGQRMVPPI